MYMSLLILKQKYYIINLNKSTINCTLRKYISPLMFMPFYMYMYIISPVLLLLGRHAYNLFVWTLAHTLFKNPIGYLLLQLYLAIVYSNFDTPDAYPFSKRSPHPGTTWGFLVIHNRARMMKTIRTTVSWNLKHVVRREFDASYSHKKLLFFV